MNYTNTMHQTPKTKHQTQGFLALISVVIISFVLLLVSLTLTLTGFFTRFDLLDSEFKKISENIADGCIESARLVLVQDSNYTGDVNIPSDLIGSINDFCKIIDSKTIVAHSEVNRAQTYYLVELDNTKSDFPIKNFTECSNYNLSNPKIC